jgi:hypothetical protein
MAWTAVERGGFLQARREHRGVGSVARDHLREYCRWDRQADVLIMCMYHATDGRKSTETKERSASCQAEHGIAYGREGEARGQDKSGSHRREGHHGTYLSFRIFLDPGVSASLSVMAVACELKVQGDHDG